MRATIRLTGCGGVSQKWRFAPRARARRRGVVKELQRGSEFRGKEGFTLSHRHRRAGKAKRARRVTIARARAARPRLRGDKLCPPYGLRLVYCVFAGGAAFSAFGAGALCTAPPVLLAVVVGTWFML